MNGELYHHGIKGMKWGVRRYQNTDGTLTSAGKKRYLKDEKFNRLCSKYKDAGYSEAEAEKIAKGQMLAKKILIGAGAVAVTAVVAYGVYKYRDNNVDRLISSKQILQTVHTEDAAERLKSGNPFFATYTKKDNKIYASKVFSHFTDQSKITHFYTDDGIKVASRGTGRKIFEDLMENNSEFKEFVSKQGMFRRPDKLSELQKPKKLYDLFNKHLVLRGEYNDRIHNIFYDALRNKGYGAVIDVNDSKLEGFTYNPIIVFDKQIKHITGSTQANATHLSTKRFMEAARSSMTRKMLNRPLSDPAIQSAALVGVGSSAISGLTTGTFIKEYKKAHPNTQLTNHQIAAIAFNSNSLIKQYKKTNPNTKLTDEQIVQNIIYKIGNTS
jgi:hypothetical protein